jgi:nucleotide-binding universal stress UspA family protein
MSRSVLTQVNFFPDSHWYISKNKSTHPKGLMLTKILVPTDGSPDLEGPLAAALEVARKTGGKIVALTVASELPDDPAANAMPASEWEKYEKYLRGEASKHLVAVSDAAAAAGVPCETVVEQSDDAAAKIVEVAARLQCDAIFMASHRKGALMKLFVGSATQKVLAHANVPVMVFR